MTYLSEEVLTEYDPNGTLMSVSRSGQLDLALNNTQDVLQYIEIRLSRTDNTNLLSPLAYKAVAASPNIGDKNRIYVNTSDSEEDLTYTITNVSRAPLVYMKMDYQNEAGGTDIQHGRTNTFLFNLTFNSTHNLPNANIIFQPALDTNGVYDSMDIFYAWSPDSIINNNLKIFDSDGDGVNDSVRWSGTITSGKKMNIFIKSHITPGINFDETLMTVDTGGECVINSSESSTFTGITIADRFSRGSAREGVELLESEDNWVVRGFIRNSAFNQQYIIHDWSIYEIGNTTPLLSSSEESILSPGETKHTEWYVSYSNKSYFASGFDWEIVWGGSYYSAQTSNMIQLPKLYAIDSFVDKTVTIVHNTEDSTRLRVRDTVRHLGHYFVNVTSVFVESRIPSLPNESANPRSWGISDLEVYFLNDTDQVNITNLVSVDTKNSDGGDGYVHVNITDFESVMGRAMVQNDRILLEYDLSSYPTVEDLAYCFFGEHTLKTNTGTPYAENDMECLMVPGPLTIKPPAIPVPPTFKPPFADIIKEEADVNFVTPFEVNARIVYSVIDTGEKGIKNFKLIAYVPGSEGIEISRTSLSVWRDGVDAWEAMPQEEFIIVDRGVTYIGEDVYREYLLEKKIEGPYEEGWDMRDGDKMELVFRAKVPQGTNQILVRAFGYNYYEDKTIFEDAYILFRRKVDIERLQIKESEFEQQKALVGTPVLWIKDIEVYNPNPASVDDTITNDIFKDTISAYIVKDGEKIQLEMRKGINSTYVEWPVELGAKQKSIYLLEVTTPPVLEIEQEANVIESNKTLAKVEINFTLKNFAEEGYTDIYFIYPAEKEEILWIDGGDFSIRDGEVDIVISGIAAGETHNISIVYREIPPVLKIFLDSLKYTRDMPLEAIILYIPSNETGAGHIEFEVLGPEDGPVTIYSDIINTQPLFAGEEEKIERTIDISGLYSGKYTAFAKFRKNFVTLLSDSRVFHVEYPERAPIGIDVNSVIIISIVACAIILIRVYKTHTFKTEVERLRERAERLGRRGTIREKMYNIIEKIKQLLSKLKR